MSGPELLCKLTTSEFPSSEDKAVAFAERIVARIKDKVDLFIRGEIEHFDQNWLCIINAQVDDWVFSKEFYRAVLLGALGTDRSLRETFDMIYMVSFTYLSLTGPTLSHLAASNNG